MTTDLTRTVFSAVVYDEISRLAWEHVIKTHPDRALELQFVCGMVQRATQWILQDPGLSAELERRVQQTTREISAEWHQEALSEEEDDRNA